MSTVLLGDHVPGDTLLHRLPAGAKLGALLVAGVVVVALSGPVLGPVSAVVATLLAVAVVTWAGGGVRLTLRALRGVLVLALLLGAWQVWQQGWAPAVEAVGDLVALVLLATVLTVTTPVDELLDTLTRALGVLGHLRLGRLRVDPERIALAFALMLRAVPATLELAEQTRQAAMARGLERSPRARLVPLVIRVIARAHHNGDALHARGIGD